MPLSPAPARRLLHQRDIVLCGYEREDGLFDIEAELADTKTYAFSTEDRGELQPGERLHGMKLRLTVDEDLRIIACEAITEFGPYHICPQAAGNFSRLAGLVIGRGFLKEALARVAGTEGCTHLRELLQQVATVAFQTTVGLRRRRGGGGQRGLLNTCLAYGQTSPVVARRWPELYTGPALGDPSTIAPAD
jgi:hypothetical protein